MVDKKFTKRVMERIAPKVTPIGMMGTEALILPNHSGIKTHPEFKDALGNALGNYVPYTGATTGVNLGSQTLTTTGTGTLGALNVTGNAQLGDSSTDYHGINTAPVSTNMLTASFSNAVANSQNKFIEGTFVLSGDITDGQNPNYNYGNYLNFDISGSKHDATWGSHSYNYGSYIDMDDTSTLVDGQTYNYGYYADVYSAITPTAGYSQQPEMYGARHNVHVSSSLVGTDAGMTMFGTYNYLYGNLGPQESPAPKDKYGFFSHVGGTAGTNTGYYASVYGTTSQNTGYYADVTAGTYNYAFKSYRGDWFMQADNSKFIFGAGKDVSIKYDGTNTLFTNEVGTGEFQFGGVVKATGYKSSDGSAGLSATYTFGGGASGNIATMTFKNGLLTATTTVP